MICLFFFTSKQQRILFEMKNMSFYEFRLTSVIFQEQPPDVFYEKRRSYIFHKIHRKAPLPKSFFYRPAILFKKTVLLWILRILKNDFFTEHLRVTASDF